MKDNVVAISKDDKTRILLNNLTNQLCEILDRAEQEGSIDYFKIEILNHCGTLQVDYKFRERTRVY